MEKAIIRKGDRTSHGGTVLEGSPNDICEGKPIAFVGHKVSCPKCSGTHQIIEGAPATMFYSKGVALAGMKTSCGATLIATQFVSTVEIAAGGGVGNVGTKETSNVAQRPVYSVDEKSNFKANSERTFLTESAQLQDLYDEQPKLVAKLIEGVPYYVETLDGRTFSGRTGVDGVLPRIDTKGEDDYWVYWGDEALAKMEGAKV